MSTDEKTSGGGMPSEAKSDQYHTEEFGASAGLGNGQNGRAEGIDPTITFLGDFLGEEDALWQLIAIRDGDIKGSSQNLFHNVR